MIIENPKGERPKIHSKAFVASNATIIGNVTIHEGANIWYGAVLRGDTCKIEIGKNTSIQDNCVVHSETDTEFVIKDHCIVGHRAMLHGPAVVGSCTTVGIGAVVLQGSNVGDGVIVGSGAVVTKNLPEDVMALGIPARVKKQLKGSGAKDTKKNANFYAKNGMSFVESGKNHPDVDKFPFD